jgi:hypothetical protein
LQKEWEAARYTAQRAQKQYDTSDPDNRLVTSELERRWNQALQKVLEIEVRIEKRVRRRRAALATPEEFQPLASNIEAVWQDPQSDVRLKKQIVRTLIEEVIVDINGEGEKSLPSYIGEEGCTPTCECPGGDGGTMEPTRRKRFSKSSEFSLESAPTT